MNAAGPFDEVALFNYETVFAVDWIDWNSGVMNQVSAQRATSATGCRILGNIVRWSKQSCMSARIPNFHRFSGEGIAGAGAGAEIKVCQQAGIHTTLPQ